MSGFERAKDDPTLDLGGFHDVAVKWLPGFRVTTLSKRAIQDALSRYTDTYILPMADKPLRWAGSSLEDLRAFTDSARQQAGRQLGRLQQGLLPDDWRPMPSVGAGVAEIRLHADGEYRVLYIAKFAEAIYVLHVFEKRTQRSRHIDLALARKRLADVVRWRRGW
jgi:phage-related protein